MGGGGHFVEECTPALTTSGGDNQMSVVIIKENERNEDENGR